MRRGLQTVDRRRDRRLFLAVLCGCCSLAGIAPEQPFLASEPDASSVTVRASHNTASQDLIGRAAEAQIRNGFTLAERGAVFSAQAEFVQALRIVAHSHGAEHESNRATRALKAGLLALKEADDFLPRRKSLEADADLEPIIALHRTPILKRANVEQLTPLVAIRKYLAYAADQLLQASAGQPVASKALYGMARLQPYLADSATERTTMSEPKSIMLLSVAVEIDKSNYKAANELGVLLARHGQMQAAKDTLLQGLAASQQPELCRNLAAVCDALGDKALAQQMRHQAQSLPAKNGGAASESHQTGVKIQWVDPQAFAREGDEKMATTVSNVRAPAQPKPTQVRFLPAIMGSRKTPRATDLPSAAGEKESSNTKE